MKFSRLTILALIFIAATYSNSALALEVDTHKYLNKLIAQGNYGGWSLDLYLRDSLGFSNGVYEDIPGYTKIWERIELGGYKEDITGIPYLRSIKHFHDPLAADWSSAGFKGAQSSIIWAETKNQSWLLGNYSWPDAREYFFKALTATDENTRNTNYAECFRAVGQVMHLVEDVSVPEHTRDDFHAFYNYENEVLKLQGRPGALQDMLPSTSQAVDYSLLNRTDYNSAATIPIAGLFDADKYTGSNPGVTTTSPVGLAEYTNANFFSRDTVVGKYQYPSLSNCQKGDWEWVQDPKHPDDPAQKVRRKYYTKTNNGETGYKLATLSREWIWGSIYMPEESAWLTVRDDNVYEDYARKLIPKAVEYSAGMLNYFFRGQLEAVGASSTTDSDNKVTGMTLKVKNNTPDEDMVKTDNSHLVVSYNYMDGSQKHFGKSGDVSLRADIPLDNTTDDDTYQYSFTFASSIPADATDEEFFLVYRGKLGAEDDAVAAKNVKLDPERVLVDIRGLGDESGVWFDSGVWTSDDSWCDAEGNIFPTSLGGKTITKVNVPLAIDVSSFSREQQKAIAESGNYRVFVEVWKFTPQYVPLYGASDRFADLNIFDSVVGVASGSVVIGNDGNDYRCTKAHQASSSNKPVTGGSWSSYWMPNNTIGQGTAWASGNYYSEGMRYRCIKSHAASPDTEPGVGANWITYWEPTSSTPFDTYCPVCCRLYDKIWQNGLDYRGDLYGKSNELSFASLSDILPYSWEGGYTKIDFPFSTPATIPENTSVYIQVRFSEASQPIYSWVSLVMDWNYSSGDVMEGGITYEPWDVIKQYTPCDRSANSSRYDSGYSAAMTIYGH